MAFFVDFAVVFIGFVRVNVIILEFFDVIASAFFLLLFVPSVWFFVLYLVFGQFYSRSCFFVAFALARGHIHIYFHDSVFVLFLTFLLILLSVLVFSSLGSSS